MEMRLIRLEPPRAQIIFNLHPIAPFDFYFIVLDGQGNFFLTHKFIIVTADIES